MEIAVGTMAEGKWETLKEKLKTGNSDSLPNSKERRVSEVVETAVKQEADDTPYLKVYTKDGVEIPKDEIRTIVEEEDMEVIGYEESVKTNSMTNKSDKSYYLYVGEVDGEEELEEFRELIEDETYVELEEFEELQRYSL